MNSAVTIIAFPVVELINFIKWWYGAGLLAMFAYLGREIKEGERKIGFVAWFKALGVPMYGQWDWQGRIISFFFRLILLVWKAVYELGWLIIHLLIVLIYILLPISSLAFIFYHLINLSM